VSEHRRRRFDPRRVRYVQPPTGGRGRHYSGAPSCASQNCDPNSRTSLWRSTDPQRSDTSPSPRPTTPTSDVETTPSNTNVKPPTINSAPARPRTHSDDNLTSRSISSDSAGSAEVEQARLRGSRVISRALSRRRRAPGSAHCGYARRSRSARSRTRLPDIACGRLGTPGPALRRRSRRHPEEWYRAEFEDASRSGAEAMPRQPVATHPTNARVRRAVLGTCSVLGRLRLRRRTDGGPT
jgi:hypothetical protein